MQSKNNKVKKETKFPSPVKRIRLLWKKGKWKIQKEVSIPKMTLPASAEIPDPERATGFWYEAVDNNGNLLYRRLKPNPFSAMHESFEADGSMRRIDETMESFLIDILIPDRNEIAKINIYSNVTEDSKRLKHAKQIHSLPLEKKGESKDKK